MKKYRKLPLVIEAAQWDGILLGGQDPEDIFKGIRFGLGMWVDDNTGGPIYIETLEGMMKCNPGDWIIKGVKGEFYPCKADIFKKTYEEEQPSP